MGIFTSRWERAHRSLTGLSAAQKLSAGILTTLMIGAVLWMTRQSRSVMEPVLDQPFAMADVLTIGEHLTDKKVPYEIRDGKVYVAAERKLEVLSDLIYSDTLSGDTEHGFEKLIKQTSVFDTPSKTDKMFNHALQVTLQGVIGRFKGVRKATVLIDPSNERRIGGKSITPSALVDIQTRPGEADPRQLASGAINAVTGAVSSMSRERVKVTIDGASFNLGADDFGGDFLDRRQESEQAHVNKVRQLLSYIPDVLVSVSVDVNLQSQDEEKRIVDPEKRPRGEVRAELHDAQEAHDDPFIEAATALANAVPSHTEQMSDEPQPTPAPASETVQKIRTPAGKETVLSASVVVPRSYVVQIYRRGTPTSVEPTDALLQPIVDAQLSKIRQLVRTSLGLRNDSDVTVELYEDAGGTAVVASAQTPSATRQEAGTINLAPLAGLWKQHRAWAIGIVGVGTLLVASMMFRRGGGAIAMPHPIPRPVRVHASAPMARDYDDADEEDQTDTEDDAELLQQVRALAADPQGAARVMREWIHQS